MAQITERISQPATRAYVDGGRQPAEAYDLSAISPGQLELLPVAVSDSAGEAKFFEPPNPDDVPSDVPDTQAISEGAGARAVTASGSRAPKAKLPADASAACSMASASGAMASRMGRICAGWMLHIRV